MKTFSELTQLRKKINVIDKQLLLALSRRKKTVLKIGVLKKDNKLPALDTKRWQEVIKNRTELGKKLHLSEEFIKKLFELIHKNSLEIEESVNV